MIINKRLQKLAASSDQNGLTLIELAIVLMISGLMLVMVWQTVRPYMQNWQRDITLENIDLSARAMDNFFSLNGRYPCPADPTIGPGHAEYGREQCRHTIGNPLPADCTVIPNIHVGALECYDQFAEGVRDADGDGNADTVLVGALPWRTLNDFLINTRGRVDFQSPERVSVDGYRHKLAYAVTEKMTDVNANIGRPVSTNIGAFPVIDEMGNDVTQPPQSAHYAIFSYGENGRGAYSKEGSLVEGCLIASIPVTDPLYDAGMPTAPGGTGLQRDIENCDRNDAIFTNAIYSLGDNDFYNDDTLIHRTMSVFPLWRRDPASPSTGNYIYNTNPGNIGVGVNDPVNRLHIGGSLSAETGMITTETFIPGSPRGFCKIDGTNCFHPEFIAGPPGADECTGNKAAIGIENNQLICATAFPDASGSEINHSCPPDGSIERFIISISNTGAVCCDTVSGGSACCIGATGTAPFPSC